MNEDKLKLILMDHEQWLADNNTGKRADLRYADLADANLRYADLRRANLGYADLIRANLAGANLNRADLKHANLAGADLTDANLTNANLTNANLTNADLTGADLDFSSFPLWCGSFGIKVNERIAWQLLYHFCRLDCDSKEYITVRTMVAEYANKFHRVDECGKI